MSKLKNKIIVFPGSFNPFHIGHLELVKKYLEKNKVIILISNNPSKEFISFNLRYKQTKEFLNKQNILNYNNLFIGINFNQTMEFIKSIGTNYILRGYRNKIDYKYEKNLKQEYLSQNYNLKFLLRKVKKFKDMSSSLIRLK